MSANTTHLEQVLKVDEVALALRCERNSVYKLIDRGDLRAVHVGRVIRVPQSALSDFIAGRPAGE